MAGNDTTVSVARSVRIALAALLANGCTQPEIPTVADLDIDRFMGRWYVQASIPTFLERGAHNAVETYRRDTDGTIHTTFIDRRDAFDGELVEYKPRGFVTADLAAADYARFLTLVGELGYDTTLVERIPQRW